MIFSLMLAAGRLWLCSGEPLGSRQGSSACVAAYSWPSAGIVSDAQLCSGTELQATLGWLNLPCEASGCLCLARHRPEHLAMAPAGLAQDCPGCSSAQPGILKSLEEESIVYPARYRSL